MGQLSGANVEYSKHEGVLPLNLLKRDLWCFPLKAAAHDRLFMCGVFMFRGRIIPGKNYRSQFCKNARENFMVQ